MKIGNVKEVVVHIKAYVTQPAQNITVSSYGIGQVRPNTDCTGHIIYPINGAGAGASQATWPKLAICSSSRHIGIISRTKCNSKYLSHITGFPGGVFVQRMRASPRNLWRGRIIPSVNQGNHKIILCCIGVCRVNYSIAGRLGKTRKTGN